MLETANGKMTRQEYKERYFVHFKMTDKTGSSNRSSSRAHSHSHIFIQQNKSEVLVLLIGVGYGGGQGGSCLHPPKKKSGKIFLGQKSCKIRAFC